MSHEEAVVNAFIIKDRRSRVAELLAKPKRRASITRELSHFNWLDPRFTKAVPNSCHDGPSLAAFLRKKGAGSKCWVISEDSDFDGREVDLEEILEHIYGREIGTIVSCIPGKLAYFEGEDGRFLLEK